MANIKDEIAAYERMRDKFEADGIARSWVLIHAGTLIGVYDSFETAAADAVAKFGRGPYLIRQVGAPPLTLPASVMYRPTSDGKH